MSKLVSVDQPTRRRRWFVPGEHSLTDSTFAGILTAGAFPLAWQEAVEEARIPLERLDGPTRAKVLAALAGLVILGLGMVALTWLGARVTRRYMNPASIKPKRRRASLPPQEDWASKPLVEDEMGLPAGPEPPPESTAT